MAVHSGARDHWEKIAFITALCERHYPNFQLYCEATDASHNGEAYRKILNKVWEFLAGQLTSIKNLEKALLQLEDITPQPMEEDGYGVYPALDACLLLTSSLQMIMDDSIDDTETAAQLSLATVHQFIEMVSDESFDPETQQHELYTQERELQQEVRRRLQEKLNTATITKQLRHYLREFEASNLGITLE